MPMSRNTLKLYRGLSADEFKLAGNQVFIENKKVWSSILEYRAKGDLKYPNHLEAPIKTLHKNLRLERQYFTDSKAIAEGYARKVEGLLVELSVPLKDVIQYFDIEFQNFARRKKQFEIVYCIKGSSLLKFKSKWGLKVKKLKSS